MGHLYKSGVWFKKKSVLQAESHYNTEKSADGTTDLRTTYKIYRNTNSSILSVADANKYFFLPTLGGYVIGQLSSIPGYGFYWSSSADPRGYSSAYALRINSSFSDVDSYGRGYGFRVEPMVE